MRSVEGLQERRSCLAEKQMTQRFGPAMADPGAGGAAADPAERVGDALWMSSELHGRRVRQELTLAADGSLDEIAEEGPDIADRHEPERQDRDLARAAAPASAAAEGGRSVAAAAHKAAADDADRENAEEHGGKAEVQAHVAVEHVAELMPDDALKLVATQRFHAAARHAHNRIVRAIARGESVDAGLVEHVNGRDRQACGDGHFLDHVEHSALVRIRALRQQEAAAEALGDSASTV